MAQNTKRTKKGPGRLLAGALVAICATGLGYWQDTKKAEVQGLWPIPNLPSQFQNWTLTDVTNSFNMTVTTRYLEMEPCASVYDIHTLMLSDYDPRYIYPDCFVPPVRQGNDTALAYTLAATISDRYCVQSKGKKKVALNPQQLIDCDSNYKHRAVDAVWGYASTAGLFNSSKPYPCEEESVRGNRRIRVENACVTFNEAALRREIKTNGPIIAQIPVYLDFLNYTGGIYSPVQTYRLPGLQTVEVLGWGSDMYSGLTYWLVKNSWGTDWGEKGWARLNREVFDISDLTFTATPVIEEEPPEPKVMQPVRAEELDLSRIVL